MNQVNEPIRSAEELHQFLHKNKNFDFKPENGRDAVLYQELKRSLDLPDGTFLKALRERNVSAQQYLRALMEVTQPLAEMYRAILAYCERANFLRSKGGAEIQWEIGSGGEQIGFSPEAFRRFDKVKAAVEPSRELMRSTKNEIMDWLAKEVFAPNGLDNKNLDWSNVTIFKILADARDRYSPEYEDIFKGLNNHYLGGTHARPSEELESRVTQRSDYPAKLSTVAKVFNVEAIESVASEFIELPFWKFRWQIYEIWVIAVSLSELEQFGFKLVANNDGCSMIELGAKATLATHAGSQNAFIYQPMYQNRLGNEIRPDIVISKGEKETASDVRLIIECKQRISLVESHLDDVQHRYEAGVDTSIGEVFIVNYDDVPSWSPPDPSKTTLIGNMHPKSTGEEKFRSALRKSKLAKSLRKEDWFVDISLSMSKTLNDDFRSLLTERLASLQTGSYRLYGFAEDIRELQPCQLKGDVEMSDSADAPNWEGRVIDPLGLNVNECLKDESTQVYIVSDIAEEIGSKILAADSKLDRRIHFLDPNKECVLNIIAEYAQNQ